MIKTITEKTGAIKIGTVVKNRALESTTAQYSLRNYAFLFFAFSVTGWIWELVLFMAVQQKIVNTGLLHGPWLPIYGIGGIMILELFKKLRHHPGKTFTAIVISAGILEYSTHAATERIFGVTWWDYSEYFLSINGRICIEGLIAFGILGCISIYFIAPKFCEIFNKITLTKQDYMIFCLSALFLADVIFSFINPNYQNIYH